MKCTVKAKNVAYTNHLFQDCGKLFHFEVDLDTGYPDQTVFVAFDGEIYVYRPDLGKSMGGYFFTNTQHFEAMTSSRELALALVLKHYIVIIRVLSALVEMSTEQLRKSLQH